MKKLSQSFVLLFLVFSLSACGMMKSIFPDKEKDYRFTRELPPLVIPNDLNQQGSPSQVSTFANQAAAEANAETTLAPTAEVVAPPTSLAPVQPLSISTAEQSKALAPVPEPAASAPMTAKAPVPAAESSTAVQTTPLVEAPIDGSKYAQEMPDAETLTAPEISLLKTSEHTSILHFNQNLERTWRIVGKALTQKAIEISERNTTAHYYVVEYEPNVKKLKDETWWDDIKFVFGAENNQEQIYRVAMREKDQQTDIQVLNAENKLCGTDACNQLTLLLKKSIEKAIQK